MSFPILPTDYHVSVGHTAGLWVATVDEFPDMHLSGISIDDVLQKVAVSIGGVVAASRWEKERLAQS